MFCMHCGKELESGAKFCAYCGCAVEQQIKEESVQIPPDPSLYDGGEGEQVAAESTESTPQPMPAQPVPAQQVYYVPVMPAPQPAEPAQKEKINAFGIAGFSAAIASWVFVFSYIGAIIGLILDIIAFGLSLTGVILKKKFNRVWGLALAGLIVSSVMLFIWIFVVLILISVANGY